MKNIYLVAIICNKKIRSGTKYGATVGMVGDGKQLLLDVELPDIWTRGTVEAEQEGLVRGHIPSLARGWAGPGDLGEASTDVAGVRPHEDDGGRCSGAGGVEGGGLEVVLTGAEDDGPGLLRSANPGVEDT